MEGLRRLAAPAIAALLLLGAAQGGARAADPPPVTDEAAFLAALEQAKATLAQERPRQGLDLIQKALEQHQGKDYVRAKRPDLEDLVHRLAFRADCPPPEPQSVVKGRLKKFVSRSGDLEIHYFQGQPNDFTAEGEQLLFPARFRGPFMVTIRGDSYPSTTDASPIVEVGLEENAKTHRRQAWAIGFGIAPYDEGQRKVWVPARIIFVDGEAKNTIVEKASPAPPRKPYRLDVKVASGSVSASVNGDPLGSAPKPDGVFGYALLKVAGWSEIVFAGQIEPSWIQAKVDAIVEQKRTAFEAKFDVRKVLPAWLYEAQAPSAAQGPPRVRTPRALASLPPELLLEWTQASLKVVEGDYAGALAAAKDLRAKGAPDSVTGVLAAEALVGLEEPTKALAEAERALAADPGSTDALVVKGRMLLRLGRQDELVAALGAATASPDAGREVFEAAGILLMVAGRHDEARALAEGAARRGQRSPLLEALGRAVVRALNGPEWPKSYEYKTANYDVVSDIDAATCGQAASVLEDALTDFKTDVHSLKPEPKKRLYRVYLFSGEAGFLHYVADATFLGGKGPERAAGLYSPVLKQLLIWNLPNRDEMMRTVRHEGFHQYLDRLLPDPPVWFNEGLAVYYEAMKRFGATLNSEAVRPDFLATLKGTTLEPLSRFLHVKPAEFYAGSPRSYAQAWLLIHMLRHGTQKHRDLYRALLSRLEALSGPEAVRAVFDDASLPALDADLQAYLTTLSARK